MQADAPDDESLSSLRGRRPQQSMDSEGMDCFTARHASLAAKG